MEYKAVESNILLISFLKEALYFTCSKITEKDSVSFFLAPKFFFNPLESTNIKLFFNSKKYFCSFFSLKKNFKIFIKSKNLLLKNYSLRNYIFVYDLDKKIRTEKKTFPKKFIKKRNKKSLIFPLMEKSIAYLLDRKRKNFFLK